MKTKNIQYLIAFLLVGTLAMSCFPEDELTFEGSLVEFKNHTREWSAARLTAKGIVTTAGAQTDSTRSVKEIARVRDTVLVQLVGRQKSTPIELNFKVRAASTAIVGTHYNFHASNQYDAATRTGKVVIPPNSSFGYVLLDMVDAQAAAAICEG